MVANAISSLKERGGSSLQAIKKYITANYKVDSEKLSPFIKKYLKTAVASGELVQTKGKGASGSFKLPAAKTEKPAASPAPPRGRGGASTGPKEKKQLVAKRKVKSPKKAAVKKTSEKKKRTSPTKPKKSPSKAKKAAKVPTKKPKAPRPKTAVKAKAQKKAAKKK
jgi:histone H1/5